MTEEDQGKLIRGFRSVAQQLIIPELRAVQIEIKNLRWQSADEKTLRNIERLTELEKRFERLDGLVKAKLAVDLES